MQTVAKVDRDSARRLGVVASSIDAALYDAFGQRQVATIYTELNQYHVVMEWSPRYTRSPNALGDIYVPATHTVVSAGQAVVTENSAAANGAVKAGPGGAGGGANNGTNGVTNSVTATAPAARRTAAANSTANRARRTPRRRRSRPTRG